MISIFTENNDRICVQFPYNEQLIKLIKTIQGYKWHSDKKHWSVPLNEEKIMSIINTFTDYNIEIKYSDEFKEKAFGQFEVILQTLNEIEKELKIKGYSPQTRKAYLGHIRRFYSYCMKPLEKVTKEDVRKYLVFLVDERKNSAAFVNQVYSALKFLFTFLGLETGLDIPRCKKEKKLPVVANKDEVVRIFSVVKNIKHKAILMLIYSSGLRVSEVVRIRVEDIDGKRNMLRVKQSKGKKDRYTVLSSTALEVLRQYFKKYRPEEWLFPGSDGVGYLSVRTVQKVFQDACKKANIMKDISVHCLRHSFATHLLEDGIDIKYIQELLGHESCKTTEIYTHVTEAGIKKIISPLDRLNLQT